MEYADDIGFVTVDCPGCGCMFGMTKAMNQRLRENHNTFWCPRGCAQSYRGKSEAEKLREQLDQERRNHEATQGRVGALQDQNAKISRQYTKIRERVSKGVCPCCNRTFQNLMAHMKSQHPEFSDPRKAIKFLRDTFGLTQCALADEIGLSPVHISNYERGKQVSARTEDRIQTWLTANT